MATPKKPKKAKANPVKTGRATTGSQRKPFVSSAEKASKARAKAKVAAGKKAKPGKIVKTKPLTTAQQAKKGTAPKRQVPKPGKAAKTVAEVAKSKGVSQAAVKAAAKASSMTIGQFLSKGASFIARAVSGPIGVAATLAPAIGSVAHKATDGPKRMAEMEKRSKAGAVRFAKKNAYERLRGPKTDSKKKNAAAEAKTDAMYRRGRTVASVAKPAAKPKAVSKPVAKPKVSGPTAAQKAALNKKPTGVRTGATARKSRVADIKTQDRLVKADRAKRRAALEGKGSKLSQGDKYRLYNEKMSEKYRGR